MPKLYGAPAYARPPALPVNPVEKPFDPDDLPLEAARTDEDEALASQVQARPDESVAAAEAGPTGQDPSSRLHGRAFSIRLPGRGNAGR